MNKLNSLSKFLSREGLEKESSEILSILKLARTDEDLGAKADFQDLPAAERKKRMSNLSIYKTLTPKQRSDAAHGILDVIGMVPGPGDVADLVNAIWYAGEGNYSMAALSCVFLTPGLGTPAAALAKTTKVLPAKVIYEYADVFEDLVVKLAPEIPNGPLVKQAIDQIIEGARKGYDLSLDTGKSIMRETSQQVGGAAAKVMDPENAWYLNPKWQEWFMKIIQPALTRVLNGVTERSFKTRMMKSLMADKGFATGRLKFLKDDPKAAALFREQILNGNTELAKKVSGSIVRLLDDVKGSVKIKLITSKSAIPAGEQSTYAIVDLRTSEISVFLPNYTGYLKNPSSIIESIQNSISHEVWHLIDSKLQKAVFDEQTAGKLMSDLYSSGRFIDAIKSNFDLRGLTPDDIRYLSDNSEIYVRIKSIKSIVHKAFKNQNFDYSALHTLVKNIDNPSFASFYKSMPFDAKQLLSLLRNASDEQLQTVALFMNKVP